MQIGYIYDLEAYPPRGGNHRHVLELVQGFLKQGHNVCVVNDKSMPNVSNYSEEMPDLHLFIKKIQVLYVRIDARPTREWKILANVMSMAIRRNIPVVWEINSPEDEGLAFSWLGGAQSIGAESLLRRARRWVHAFNKKPAIWLESINRKKLAKDVDSAICVSTAVGDYAKETLGISDVTILPNGGVVVSKEEISQRRERRENENFTVFYGGSAIYPWQGLNFLSAVISLAQLKAPDVQFVLAVNQRSNFLPDSSNVVIKEKLSQEQIKDEICAADVCVALIPEWPWAKYGFHGSPTKLFEYMSYMVAVITSNHSQMAEIIEDGENGVLCNNEPEEILQKILWLKKNQERASQIGLEAWKVINQEFNWINNAAVTINVFKTALAAAIETE